MNIKFYNLSSPKAYTKGVKEVETIKDYFGVNKNIYRYSNLVDIFIDTETCTYIANKKKLEEYLKCTDEKKERALLKRHAVTKPYLYMWKGPNIRKSGVWTREITDKDHYINLVDKKFYHCDSTTLENLIRYVEILYANHIHTAWVFHNTRYDISASAPYLKMKDPKMELSTKLEDSSYRHITGAIKFKGKIPVRLHDSMRYIIQSLDKYAKSQKDIEVKKGKIPYQMMNAYRDGDVLRYIDMKTKKWKEVKWEEIISYCQNDIEIMENLWYETKAMKETILKDILLGRKPNRNKTPEKRLENEINKSLTLGGDTLIAASFYLYMNDLSLDKGFRYQIDKDEYLIQDRSAMGGYVSQNKYFREFKCQKGWIIDYYDVTSMYPDIIRNGLPYGKPSPTRHAEDDIVIYGVYVSDLFFNKLENWLGAPAIPESRQNGENLVYLWKDFYEILKRTHSGEMKIATFDNRFGEKYKGLPYVMFYRRVTDLKVYIDKCVEIRDFHKKERDKYEEGTAEYKHHDRIQNVAKVLMNSLYGKLCEKQHPSLFEYDQELKLRELLKTEEQQEKDLCNMMAGIYITQASKTKVLTALERVCQEKFIPLYIDTDSIQFARPIDAQEIAESIFGNTGGKKLGEWKLEGRFHEFKTKSKKKYLLINLDDLTKIKIVYSGVKLIRSLQESSIEIFKKGTKKQIEERLFLIRALYDIDKNYLIVNAKPTKIILERWDQDCIINCHHFTTPKSLRERLGMKALKKLSGYIWKDVRDGEFKLTTEKPDLDICDE